MIIRTTPALSIVGVAAIIIIAIVFIFPDSDSFKNLIPFQKKSPSILFTGDVMLGRNVENLRDEHGENYPFLGIASTFRDASNVVINLEGPINTEAAHRQTPSMGFQFSFEPKVAETLAAYGVRFASLGNNHGTDYGNAGYESTVLSLTANGITPIGHAGRINENSVATSTLGESSIAFVSLNASHSHEWDEENALSLVGKIRADFVIVMIHWGDEYALTSNDFQKNLAHKLVDAGADLIIGHHPHVVQEVEKYKNSMIFYSLGNFIFDQYFSQDVKEGLLVSLTLRDGKPTYKLIPVISERSQPMPMGELTGADFLLDLADRSDPVLYNEISSGIIRSK